MNGKDGREIPVSKYGTLMRGRVEAIVKTRDGRIIQKHSQPMKSFTRNFAVLLANLFSTPVKTTSGTTPLTCYEAVASLPYKVTELSGNVIDLRLESAQSAPNANMSLIFYGISSPVGDDSYGIIIGRDSRAPSPYDYTIYNKYKQGEFDYGNTVVEEPVTSGNNTSFRITRLFVNKLTGDAQVNEVGIVAYKSWPVYNYTSIAFLLIARDVFSQTVTVPQGAVLIIRYVLSITT